MKANCETIAGTGMVLTNEKENRRNSTNLISPSFRAGFQGLKITDFGYPADFPFSGHLWGSMFWGDQDLTNCSSALGHKEGFFRVLSKKEPWFRMTG
jgi:hypothetical protein